jgi:hypothetical protein
LFCDEEILPAFYSQLKERENQLFTLFCRENGSILHLKPQFLKNVKKFHFLILFAGQRKVK